MPKGKLRPVITTSQHKSKLEGWLGAGSRQNHPNPPSFILSLSFIASVQVNTVTQLFLSEFSPLHLGKSSSRECVGS